MRLFVALPLPRETRKAFIAWTRKCVAPPILRWTPEEQLHITMHFLGEVEDARVRIVTVALDGIHARSFDVEFDRIEVLGRASVLVAATKLTPQIAALEIDVRARVLALGKMPEAGREFRPHVTLARARRGESVPKVRSFPPLPKIGFAATCFRLYRSELLREGAVHTIIREWPLDGSS